LFYHNIMPQMTEITQFIFGRPLSGKAVFAAGGSTVQASVALTDQGDLLRAEDHRTDPVLSKPATELRTVERDPA
jgi:hypothetical protein